jgi:WD40 repeat protein
MAKKAKKSKPQGGPTSLARIETKHKHHITALCFLPGNRFLLSGSADASIRLWNLCTGAEQGLWMTRPEKWGVTDLAISPDGYTLAAMSEARQGETQGYPQPFLMNLVGQHQRVFTLPERLKHCYAGLAVSRTAVAIGGKEIQMFDINTFEEAGPPWEDCQCRVLAFRPSGQRLLSGHISGEVKEWNVSEGTCVEERSDHEGAVTALGVSRDDAWMASADNATISFWDTDAEAEQTFGGDWKSTDALAFLAGRELLVSLHDVGGEEAKLHFWSLPDAEDQGQWAPEEGLLRAFAVSQDGTRLTTATVTESHTHLIQVWDVQALLNGL